MISGVSLIGYLAASLVAATFYMHSMIPLRCFAIASNICFIIYAYYTSPQLYPILILHAFLLPLNISRLWQLIHKKPIQMDWLQRHDHARSPLSFSRDAASLEKLKRMSVSR
ncbi:hypothetical protein AQUSIP_02420 [Aquicella siphonis]|uniref:Uncharacterized protein n=1 Tax=Aquicella siphonis TaxID=254247 RepID=A0A5E4PEQ4_9COXI|nr:hypothetical protein [Aquicella siphonis]VVC74968.1 hypothetical protein AQUSIP_02420 [Aquicella siphonis]